MKVFIVEAVNTEPGFSNVLNFFFLFHCLGFVLFGMESIRLPNGISGNSNFSPNLIKYGEVSLPSLSFQFHALQHRQKYDAAYVQNRCGTPEASNSILELPKIPERRRRTFPEYPKSLVFGGLHRLSIRNETDTSWQQSVFIK